MTDLTKTAAVSDLVDAIRLSASDDVMQSATEDIALLHAPATRQALEYLARLTLQLREANTQASGWLVEPSVVVCGVSGEGDIELCIDTSIPYSTLVALPAMREMYVDLDSLGSRSTSVTCRVRRPGCPTVYLTCASPAITGAQAPAA